MLTILCRFSQSTSDLRYEFTKEFTRFPCSYERLISIFMFEIPDSPWETQGDFWTWVQFGWMCSRVFFLFWILHFPPVRRRTNCVFQTLMTITNTGNFIQPPKRDKWANVLIKKVSRVHHLPPNTLTSALGVRIVTSQLSQRTLYSFRCWQKVATLLVTTSSRS